MASAQLESVMPWAATAPWNISKTTGTIAPTVVMESTPLNLVLKSAKASSIA